MLSEAAAHLAHGDTGAAIAVAARLGQQLAQLSDSVSHPGAEAWLRLGEFWVQAGCHARARDCHARALALAPGSATAAYNLATSCVALGELEYAETLFTRAIQLDPGEHDAWYNRSTLRRQTPERNHVAALRAILEHLAPANPGRIALHYALAKELEDLGQYAESFQALQAGAAARRRRLSYAVQDDEATLAGIAAAFDADCLARRAAPGTGAEVIFILGLPRSGTTLVERILAAHSAVGSIGESPLLASCVGLAANTNERSALDPGSTDRGSLVRATAAMDPAPLGQRYLSGLHGFGIPGQRLIDKTPLNFLYLGLIHKALPGARVIHLRRHPLDSCLAMYKTLFRMGYPFSYSLQDTGRYYIAYHRLVAHWRATIPGTFLDLDYAALVHEPEAETRRLLAWLGLDWEPACLDFHARPGVAATASAAQVRQPVYTSSAGAWRRYAKELAPLAAKLQEHGISVD